MLASYMLINSMPFITIHYFVVAIAKYSQLCICYSAVTSKSNNIT